MTSSDPFASTQAPAPLDLTGAVLLLIDVQKGFDDPRWGKRCTPELEANVSKLLLAWRSSGNPVIHVRHASRKATSTLHASHPGHAFKPEADPLPGEVQLVKDVHSAFIGTDLESRLKTLKADRLVVVGIQTNYCVATTARMANNLGYDVTVVADACATFDQPLRDGRMVRAQMAHEIVLAELDGEFGRVVSTDEATSALKVVA
jgi:nicotinamidase-related amidase